MRLGEDRVLMPADTARSGNGRPIVHVLCAFWRLIQISPKLFKIQQSPPTPGQRKSKKKAWISLDSLVRIEPFQRVIVTPWRKKSNLSSIPSQLASPSPALSLPQACAQDNTGF